jgi:AcrR family transcriptional regulator
MARTVLDRETRRQQVLEAATTVFARKGYRHTSVADIIDAAGIARGTFYLYFQSKEEIFLALIDRWFEDLTRHLDESVDLPCSSPEARSQKRSGLRGAFEFFRERRELALIVLREAVAIDDRFEERMQQLLARINQLRGEHIRQMQQAGLYRSDVDIQFLNTCFNGIFRELMLRYILPEEPPNMDWLVEQLDDFVQHGIAVRAAGEPAPS